MNPLPLFLIIVSLPLLLGGCGEKHEGISLDELQDRGVNGYFEKNQEVGYTGKVFKLHENGQIEVKGQLIKGKYDGLYVSWYKNGQKSEETNYKDDEIVSEKLWNRKGEPVD